MAFSGGVFSLVAGNPVVTLTTISGTWDNNTFNDIVTNGLSMCMLKDGTQSVTGNIPMNSFKFTGLAAGSANGDSLRYEQVNGVVTTAGDTLYASAAGTLARLGIGTAGQVLKTNSGATAPQWVALSPSTGTFTITGTGFTVNPTATARYSITNNIVTLFIPTALTGTSNDPTFTLTGLPGGITPTTDHGPFPFVFVDNGVQSGQPGAAIVNSTSIITLYSTFNPSAGSFTAGGTKTLGAGVTFRYSLS